MALRKSKLVVISADIRRICTHNDAPYRLSDAFIVQAMHKPLAQFGYFGLVLYWPIQGKFEDYSLWEIEIARRGTDGTKSLLTWRFFKSDRHDLLTRMFRSVLLIDRRHVEAFKKVCDEQGVIVTHYERDGELTI